MTPSDNKPTESEPSSADLAVSRRLKQLSTLPVDTSSLDRAILLAIPKPASGGDRSVSVPWRSRWLTGSRGIAAAAASISVVAVVALVMALSARPVLAEPASMADLHRDLISGRLPMTRVSSIAQANSILSQSWPDGPEVPTLPALPADHDMACCLKDVKGRRVICVVMDDQGIPISIVIAPKTNVRVPTQGSTTPGSSPTSRAMVHTKGSLSMVMKERDGLFVCVMGEAPPERLQAIADSMQF